MKKFLFSINLMLSIYIGANSQVGVIKGKITDNETGEELIGASIQVQGTTSGTITDFEGNYLIKNITSGNYNLVVSYVSYNQEIVHVQIKNRDTSYTDIKLKPITNIINEVVVKKSRRTDNDLAMISSIKSSNLIVSGISSQQISKTQDKDAAEVVRRIPGITITDGRFIIVRGLTERYSSILLNGASAPSFEADKRAFSFDVIPSTMISNILIYKSPAPELPADFAGAVIDIVTKENADKNELSVSYSTGYRQNTTFNNDFQTYDGGNYDWLGIDDGTRSFPSSTPSSEEFKELYKWQDVNDYNTKMEKLTSVSKEFNKSYTSYNKAPFLDQNFSISLQKRFLIKKVSVGNITSLNYKYESTYQAVKRNEYDEVDSILNYRFNYYDERSKKNSYIGIIHNWLFVYGKNQKIEFRNFFNQIGESSVSMRGGDYTYNSETAKYTNLRFKSRFIYSGQLSGKHNLSLSGRTNLDWLLSYSTTNNNDPDNRRVKYAHEIGNDSLPYYLVVGKEVNVNNFGRLTQDMNEQILNSKIDFKHSFLFLRSDRYWTIKMGIYNETKNRRFDSRLLGIVAPRGNNYLDANLLSLPVEKFLTDERFYYNPENRNDVGITYKDGSNIKNNYQATTNIWAGYVGLLIPVTRFIDIYGGVRVENYNRLLTGFYVKTDSSNQDKTFDTLNFFPSINMTINLTPKHLIRLTYGKTVNRPEFREVSSNVYEDFDLNALVHGRDSLQSAYIDNFDIRYEWYPSDGEVVSLAVFHKKFTNPIEQFQIPAGTGFDYKPDNTEKASSTGIEFDIRKMIVENELMDLSLVFNASYIKSEIHTNKGYARENKRIMQGQSPYIINVGAFYNYKPLNIDVNLTYNRIGKRIAYVGTSYNPHTYDLPRNLVDIAISKKIGKNLEVKFGIKDIVNETISKAQYYGKNEEIKKESDGYRPGIKYSFGITMKL